MTNPVIQDSRNDADDDDAGQQHNQHEETNGGESLDEEQVTLAT